MLKTTRNMPLYELKDARCVLESFILATGFFTIQLGGIALALAISAQMPGDNDIQDLAKRTLIAQRQEAETSNPLQIAAQENEDAAEIQIEIPQEEIDRQARKLKSAFKDQSEYYQGGVMTISTATTPFAVLLLGASIRRRQVITAQEHLEQNYV